MKPLTRYQLADRWAAQTPIGMYDVPDTPDVRLLMRYAWLMGYLAREKQDARRRGKDAGVTRNHA